MPEGHFLRVSYPLFQWSPGHHQRENEYSVERTETIASPSNLHGSEDLDVSLNRPIESESWHYRKQSTNSGHRKKTSSASMDQTVKVTDRSAVDHTEPSNHPSQPGAGYEQPGSTGKDSVQAKAKVRNAVSRDRNANLVGDLTQETASFIKDTSANEETSQRTKPDQIFSKTAKHIRNLKKRSNTFNKLRMPLEKDVTPVEGPPCRENPRSSSQAESGAKHSRLKANASIQSENEQMYGPRTESSSPSIPAAVIASCAAIPKVEAVMNVSFLGTHRQVSEHESEKPTASAPGGVNPRDLEDIRVDLADVTTVTSEDSASVRTLDRSVKRASRARTRGSSSSTLETKDSALPAPYYTDSSSCSETVRSNSIIPESYSGLTLAKDQTLGKPSLATSFDPGKLNEKLKANVEASSFSEDRESPISGPVYAEALRSPEVASNDATSLQEPDLHATTTQKRPTSPVRIKLIEIGNRKVSGGTALNSASGSNTGLAAIEGIQILTPNALSPQSSSAISVDAISKSPECTRAPSIPLRSSSLRMASTTIKTHKKKKPRDFTPSERVLSDNSISSDPKAFILTESTSIGSMPSTGQRSDTLQDLIVDTKAHTVTADQTSNNSNPETTDLLDEVTRLPPHSLSRQSEGRPNQMVMGNRALILSGADQYYLQKKKYKEKHLSSSLQIESTFDNWDLSGSTSTASSTPSTPNKSPNKRKDSLRSKLREAGYGEASSSRHFATEDLDLARVNTMLEKFQPTEGRQDLGDFDDIIVQTVNIEGALRPKMTLGDFVRHRDLILMLEKATFVKRHQASSPTRTRQRKSKSCTNTTIGDRSLEATLSHQLDTISTEDQKSGQVEALLDQSLRHNFMEVSPNKSKTGNGLDHMSIHRSTRMSIASRDDELSQGKQTPEHCIAGRQKPVLVDKPTIQEIADKPKTVNCERDARVPNPSELNASLAVVKCWESEDSRLPSKPCLDIPTWLSSLGQHNPSQERTYLSQSSTSQFVGFDNFSDLMIVFAKMDPIENGNVQPTTETVKNGIRQVDEMDKKKDRLEVADIHTSGVGGESEHKALEGGGNKQPQIGEKVEAINPKATQALQVDVGVREKQDSVKAQEQDFSQVYHSGKTTEPTTPVESENFFRKKAAVKPSQTIPQSDRQEPTRIIVNVKEHELGQSWAIKSRISAGPTPAEAHQIATHTRQNSGASVIDQPAEFEALKELASAQTRVKASYEDHKAATKSTDESPGRSESVNNPHDETNHNRSGDGGSPVKPSNYNMVAKGGGVWKPQVENGVERTGDPWALPTGESPWGTNKQKR